MNSSASSQSLRRTLIKSAVGKVREPADPQNVSEDHAYGVPLVRDECGASEVVNGGWKTGSKSSATKNSRNIVETNRRAIINGAKRASDIKAYNLQHTIRRKNPVRGGTKEQDIKAIKNRMQTFGKPTQMSNSDAKALIQAHWTSQDDNETYPTIYASDRTKNQAPVARPTRSSTYQKKCAMQKLADQNCPTEKLWRMKKFKNVKGKGNY